ncbi:MAG: hypothetical protein LBG97_03945 [Coriobacteriales bacterium]|jgi:hypothetical protein|nr:hypothetical protein [Coriobacteriales bacterium]
MSYFKIKITKAIVSVSLVLMLGLVGALVAVPQDAEALSSQTVAYGGSWRYGRNGLAAQSLLYSSTRWHSTTVTWDSSVSTSGTVAPWNDSWAELWGLFGSPHYYYNIW